MASGQIYLRPEHEVLQRSAIQARSQTQSSSASRSAQASISRVEPVRAQALGHFEVEAEKLAAVARHEYMLTLVEMFARTRALRTGLS